MKLQSFVFSGLVLGGAALLLAPAQNSYGFTVLATSLGLGQRDFRVFDNFADSASHNNTAAQANFPSALDVELAAWKGGVEWGSKAHGNGQGDPTQFQIGDGGANFDYMWCGKSESAGGTNDNIISAKNNCAAGVVSNTEQPSSDGWRITLCDNNRTWADGPGTILGTEYDIQSAVCHELGHALGLGHSTDATATMDATIAAGTVSKRSIEADDVAGVQFIYGVVSATKPMITGASAVNGPTGITLTINGMGFTTSNDIWLTPRLATNPGADPRVRIQNLPSSSGGTKIVALLPANTPAGNGDVLVKIAGQGGDKLSNAWPIKLR